MCRCVKLMSKVTKLDYYNELRLGILHAIIVFSSKSSSSFGPPRWHPPQGVWFSSEPRLLVPLSPVDLGLVS